MREVLPAPFGPATTMRTGRREWVSPWGLAREGIVVGIRRRPARAPLDGAVHTPPKRGPHSLFSRAHVVLHGQHQGVQLLVRGFHGRVSQIDSGYVAHGDYFTRHGRRSPVRGLAEAA